MICNVPNKLAECSNTHVHDLCVLVQVVYKPQQAIAEYVVTYEAQEGAVVLPATDEADAPAQLVGGAFTGVPAHLYAEVQVVFTVSQIHNKLSRFGYSGGSVLVRRSAGSSASFWELCSSFGAVQAEATNSNQME